MPSFQRPGPPLKYQAQGTQWAASDNRIPPLWWSLGVIVFSIGWWVLS